MSRTLIVLLAVTLLIWAGQFTSARAARHVDLRLIPCRSRRRVTWMLTNSGHLQLVCAVVVAAVLSTQLAVALS